jgi:branched-chain amino acid transport system ATP-binding protein
MSAPDLHGTTPVLSVRNLYVSYNGTPAVTGYSVDLMAGTLTVMLGRNGAGKTSTLRGITGFLAHETGSARGTIAVQGQAVRHPSPYRLSKAGVGLVAERDKVFVSMTVREQLRLVTADRHETDEVLEFFPLLRARIDVRAGLLSGGERQMLATALVLLHKPLVLLVDELSLGLAPAVVRELMHYLRRLADERNLTILAADQAVHASLGVADNVQIMDSGQLVASGPLAAIDIDNVLDAYLGRNER